MKKQKTEKHIEAIESYVNGNVIDFKKYIHGLSNIELLRCTLIFKDYGYGLQKMWWLLEN